MKNKDAKIALLALRCEFIAGPKLTKKGRGWFPPALWRCYARVHRYFNTKTHRKLINFLRYIDGDTILQSVKS